jgi:hypothetical protein
MNDELKSISKLTCKNCRGNGAFTEPISVILVFAPGLDRPYPLIPADDYSVCSQCDAVFALVDRASQSHNITREAGPWSRAILLFADGRGLDVTAKRDTLDIYGKMAIA